MKVHVAAATRLEARADRSAGGVVVRGTLRDDVGLPVADSHVAISFFAPGSASALPLPWPKKCPGRTGGGANQPHVAPDEYVVDTDAQGAFCFESSLPVDQAVMKLRFAGGGLYDATAAEVPVDLAQPPIALAFDPEPMVISLDRPSYSVGLRVTAPGTNKAGWRVKISDERGRALGSADVDPDGLSRIELSTGDLAGPGPGELRASLERTPAAVAVIVHPVERHARVELEVEDPAPGGVPEDGIAVRMRAHSGRGPVPSGSIEATVGDRTVGAATVHDGSASVALTFASTRSPSVTASLRYLPDAPWWEPSPATMIRLAVRPPSAWRRAPLFVLALAVAAWMLRESYFSRLRQRPSRARAVAKASESRAIQVVRGRPAGEGWTGQVRDAHDHEALEGVRLSIIVQGFPGADVEQGVKGRAVTDRSGYFVLSSQPFSGRAIIRIEAPMHATLEQPLPSPSELLIPLVARRRRLLDRLVTWATAQWGAWDGAREPTPEQVAGRAARRAARGSLDAERGAQVEAWARAVESAAFGQAPVDEQAERKVTELEPPK